MVKKNTNRYKEWIAKGVPAVLIPGLIFASIYGIKNLEKLKNYYQDERIFPKSGEAVEIEDGDTFHLKSGQSVRLLGIDAPNRGEDGEKEAKDYLGSMILNKKVWLEYDRYQDDKYGRILSWVWINCEEESPAFKEASYMHLNGKESRDYISQKTEGCLKGELVNRRMVEEKKAEVVEYEKRGRLKYELK